MRCYDSSDSSHPLAGFVSSKSSARLETSKVGLESNCSVAKAVKSPEND